MYAALGCAVILIFQGLLGSNAVRRIALVTSIVGVVIYFMFLGSALWGSWTLIDLQRDSRSYLWPAATALFEGHWFRIERPFLYPLLAYEAIKLGGSLQALVLTQLVLYATAGIVLYTTVLAALFSSLNPILETTKAFVVAHIFAIAAGFGYFVLSSHYLGSAFYIGPELVSSVAALLALFLCLLLIYYRRPVVSSAALALAAAFCAALLVGFKPAMTVTAGLTLVLAAWGLVRHSQNLSRLVLGLILITMLAMPIAVLIVDGYFARKYGDTKWDTDGPVSAFCNNAPLIADNLQTSESAGNRLLGKTGAMEVAAFLRTVINEQHPRGGAWRIEGYNGDVCQYDLRDWREHLESKYFGATSQEIARTYQWLVIGSILEVPGAFAKRVFTQMKAYVTSNEVTCEVLRQEQRSPGHLPPPAFAVDGSVVDQLVSKYGVGPTDQSFPATPGSDLVCRSSSRMVSELRLPIISMAFILALFSFGWRRSRQREVSPGATAVLLTTGFWLSGAAIVALVHTFDVYRYVVVMFPIFIATLAIASGYIVEILVSLARFCRALWPKNANSVRKEPGP
jgi:hypothetical protein